MTDNIARAAWFKSSYSNGQTNCVEALKLPGGGMAIRDSKAGGAGPVLRFNSGEWDAFIRGVQEGEF